MEKTMVMKILEQKKIKYNAHYYEANSLDAVYVANTLNQDPLRVFKTLVTTDGSNHYYVFAIPVNQTLDLKGVAKIVGTSGGSSDDDGKRKPVVNKNKKVGPNEPCPCGSGRKYKHCCGRK